MGARSRFSRTTRFVSSVVQVSQHTAWLKGGSLVE